MPYPSEHSARIKEPHQFEKFARKNIAPGIDIILGIKGGKAEAQAYRFKKAKFTPAEAKAWLKSHDVTPMSFEKAKDRATTEYVSTEGAQSNLQSEQTSGPSQTQADPMGKGMQQGVNKPAPMGRDELDAHGNGTKTMGNTAYNTSDNKPPKGNKPCGKCDGKGECPVCNGSANCSNCKGDGEKTCFKKGEKDSCKYMGDEGHKADYDGCDKCDGSVQCPNCTGSGECLECNGSGECMDCGGKGYVADKKKDNMDGKRKAFAHIDGINTTPEWMLKPFERTAEGFLRGRACVTSVGVFEYKDMNGGVRRELRSPEEVFSPDSLNSLKLKPMTNNHPNAMVTPQNIKDVQVGNLGDNPSQESSPYGIGSYSSPRGTDPISDNIHVAIDMIIMEKQAIEDILNGKQQLSCGYECELDTAAPGARWCGMPYDFIQKNIRYNHVAIVDTARAGDDAAIRLKLDSADPDVLVQVSNIEEETMKSVKLDGVEYQAEAKVIETLTKETERADGLVAEISTMKADSAKVEAERDTLKDKVTAMEAEITQLKNDSIDPAKVNALVQARIKINETAVKAGVVVKEDSADIDIKKAVIVKVFPTAVLDGKSADYIDARFDGAVEALFQKGNASQRQILTDQLPLEGNRQDSGAPVDLAKKQYQEMLNRQRNDSRKVQANLDKPNVTTSAVN